MSGATWRTRHSRFSSQREEYVEYRFLGALCGEGWRRGRLVEVARAATDAHGYDLILSEGGRTRHVQLKASHEGARAAHQKVSVHLGSRAGGCVVWIRVGTEDLSLRSFGWFGDADGGSLPPLGDRIARHAKGDATGRKAERPDHRLLPKGCFDWLDDVSSLFDRLFGPDVA